MLNDHDAESETQLIDLALNEQIARGQELLQLLGEPVKAKPIAIVPSVPTPEVKVCVKNTFIKLEYEDAPCSRCLKRSSSLPAVIHEAVDTSGAYDRFAKLSSERSQWLQVSKSHVLHLDTCVRDGIRQALLHDVSDTSTDTPSESMEDVSVYEVGDSSMIEEVADIYGGQPTFVGCNHYHEEDAYQYFQPGADMFPCFSDATSQSLGQSTADTLGYDYVGASMTGECVPEEDGWHLEHADKTTYTSKISYAFPNMAVQASPWELETSSQWTDATTTGQWTDATSSQWSDPSASAGQVSESVWPLPWECEFGPTMPLDMSHGECYSEF
jgi:hypothetical protein